jgi:pimeloyl-ACP methyl ester carboxylesterase
MSSAQPAFPEELNAPSWFTRAVAHEPETTWLEVDGKMLEVLTWGPLGAPGLLLLHGNMAHARWWSFIAPAFMDRFRVCAFSFSGMGRSSHSPAYSISGFADEAVAVAQAAGLGSRGPFTVVGHSAGGGVAAELARRETVNLRLAILIDSLVAPEPAPAPPPARPMRIHASRESAIQSYRLIPPQPETNRYIIDWIAAASVEAVDGGWSWTSDPVLRGAFHARKAWDSALEARCPIAFITGRRSQVMTAERLANLQARFPRARFLTIDDAHHHVMVDQPLALIAALRELMEGPEDLSAEPSAPARNRTER